MNMQLKKGDLVEIKVSDLAFGGAGVGKLRLTSGEDFVLFVEGVAPGDVVSARLTKIKKQYGEARLESLVKPAANRIAPRCKHFGICGGCSLQFLSYDDQLRWKEKMVRDVLEKIGGFKDDVLGLVEPIIGCSSPWFYRNKMEYSFGENGALGLHYKKSFSNIFDLEECFLESERSVAIAQTVKKWAREKKLKPHDPRTNFGAARNLVIREGKNTGELMVNIILNGEKFPLEKDFTEMIIKEFPAITSLYRTAVTVQRGHRTVVKEFLLAGKPTLIEKLTVRTEGDGAGHFATLQFSILPQAFFQTNTKQAEVLYGKILEFAQDAGRFAKEPAKRSTAPETVLDLFCGTGTIGMFFARAGLHDGARVLGVDLNQSAIQNAKENAELNKLPNIEFRCEDVDSFLEKSQKKEQPLAALFDKKPSLRHSLLLTDPPRAGIAPKSLEKILKLKIPKWIYISCNPSTLARDLKIACENGYRLEKIQPVDMFPHTFHIETVCLLRYN